MKRVLVIDDAPDIRHVVRLALRLKGIEVYEASDGDSGIEQAVALQPDLVLCDVWMGEMDGPECFEGMRARGVTCPVVLLTANVRKHEVEGYHALGVDGVFAKPFDPLTLADRLREVYERATA